MRTCSIGLFAHVDAGKTTLSEQLLLAAGAIRSPGSVDRGTAHTDRMDIERRRGISVRSTCAPFVWKDTRINLVVEDNATKNAVDELEGSLQAAGFQDIHK